MSVHNAFLMVSVKMFLNSIPIAQEIKQYNALKMQSLHDAILKYKDVKC